MSLANGQYFIKSKSWTDCYLRLSAEGFTTFSDAGGGEVNCQAFGGAYEYLTVEKQSSGFYTISASYVVNTYLRMWPPEQQVNLQIGHADLEEFVIEYHADMGGYAIGSANHRTGSCWLSMNGGDQDMNGGTGMGGWGKVSTAAKIDTWEIFEFVPLPAKPSIVDVHHLINKWAPKVYFYGKDQFRMCTVEYVLNNSTLKRQGQPDIVHPTFDQLPTRKDDNETPYWLDIDPATRPGKPEDALVYIHAFSPDIATFVDLQFQFFYAWNGPGVAGLHFQNSSRTLDITIPVDPMGEHDCDWESCSFRIDMVSGNWVGAWLSQHSGGTWYNKKGVGTFARENNPASPAQPVVYSGNHGHATYKDPGNNIEPYFKVDIPGGYQLGVGPYNYCDKAGGSIDGGRRYQLVAVSWLGASFPQRAKWLDYPYRWGRTGGTPYDTSGFTQKLMDAPGFPSWVPGIRALISPMVDKAINTYPDNVDGPEGPAFKDMWQGTYK